MMEKLVLNLVEVATKTCNRDALEDRCIKSLSKLRSIPITNAFLLSTNIGNVIDSLKSNPHLKPIVRDHAASLLTQWKQQLYSRSSHLKPLQNPNIQKNPNTAHKKSQPKPPVKPNPKTNDLNKKKKLLTKLGQKKPTPKKLPNSKPPPRKQLVVKTDVESIRNSIRQQIFEGLNMVLRERQRNTGAYDPVGVSMAVESALYHKWGIPNNKYRSFLYNLNDAQNPDFRFRILIGELKPENITLLKPEDMASDHRRRQIENIRETALNKCIVGRDEF